MEYASIFYSSKNSCFFAKTKDNKIFLALYALFSRLERKYIKYFHKK